MLANRVFKGNTAAQGKKPVFCLIQPGKRWGAVGIFPCLPPVHLHGKLNAGHKPDAPLLVTNGVQPLNVISNRAGPMTKEVDLATRVDCRDRKLVTQLVEIGQRKHSAKLTPG